MALKKLSQMGTRYPVYIGRKETPNIFGAGNFDTAELGIYALSDEVTAWASCNLEGNWSGLYLGSNWGYIVFFSDENDVILFKMRYV